MASALGEWRVEMRSLNWMVGMMLVCTVMAGCRNSEPSEKEMNDECPNDPAKMRPGACGCGVPDVFDIVAGDYTCRLNKTIDLCPRDPLKTDPGICGCGTPDIDVNRNGLPDCIEENLDLCPDDPAKTLPGICGCGVPDDIDKDGNGLPDCVDKIYEDFIDLCPDDPDKNAPGTCGCGMKEVVDAKGNAICSGDNVDLCPDDPKKTMPGVCGCGFSDEDLDNNKIPDCLEADIDLCPNDPNKKLPGICGCNVSDSDLEPETGVPTCIADKIDLCPDDPKKTRPGICGCGVSDKIDKDKDGTPDCLDECPEDPKKKAPGICGCGTPDSSKNIADSNGDGIPNCLDACPENRWKTVEDECGCEAILYTINETDVCARVISNAQELIALRDGWNDGSINSSVDNMTFIVVDNINLGEVLDQDAASQWVGIGTQLHPFDGNFVGHRLNSEDTSPVVINAIRTSGKHTEALTLGNPEVSDVALFGYTDSARVDNIHVQISFAGDSHVAGMIANANETTLSNVQYSKGTIDAREMAAGLVAEFSKGTIHNAVVSSISAPDQITGTGENIGGLVASASNSQISNVAVHAAVLGAGHVGGIAGLLKVVSLSNAYSSGSITGGSMTASLVGELVEHSSLINAYTTSKVICRDEPCSALVASINEFSNIKNVYTSGVIVDAREGQPEQPPSNPDLPPDGDDPDVPSVELPISTPIAFLVASFQSYDNVMEKLYYWANSDFPAFPEATGELKYTDLPESFDYVSLIPVVTSNHQQLLQVLNENMICFDASCSIDNVACLQWSHEQRLISAPDSQMTVTLPVQNISVGP